MDSSRDLGIQTNPVRPLPVQIQIHRDDNVVVVVVVVVGGVLVCLFACFLVCLFACLLACLFVCLLACLFVCLFVESILLLLLLLSICSVCYTCICICMCISTYYLFNNTIHRTFFQLIVYWWSSNTQRRFHILCSAVSQASEHPRSSSLPVENAKHSSRET